MKKTAGRILKSSDVKLEGRFHLDAGRIAPGRTRGKNAALTTPQVRIVESHPEFGVIEITCSCGTKTYLRCEYSGVEPPIEAPQTQNGELGGPDQKPDQTK
jgi:hypothetical protein